MTSKEREDYFETILYEAKVLRVAKGHDYSGDEDSNRNFKEGGKRLGLKPEQVLGVYLDKHLEAIHTFIKDGVVKSEPIEGRVMDAINYLLILLSIYKEQPYDERSVFKQVSIGADGSEDRR